jgi:protein-S-isoprenylcysteine O-methyltransferase Ste14
MNYKTGRLVGQILFLISICLLCIAVFFNLTGIIVPILIITGVITALAGLIVYFLFWRCPYCHKNLPTKSMYDINYCPNCGKKII